MSVSILFEVLMWRNSCIILSCYWTKSSVLILTTYEDHSVSDVCHSLPDFVCSCMKQMPHGDSRLSSHSMSTQYHMHSYYPAGTYMTQGLGSTTCLQPFYSHEDDSNGSETLPACEWCIEIPQICKRTDRPTCLLGFIKFCPGFINTGFKYIKPRFALQSRIPQSL